MLIGNKSKKTAIDRFRVRSPRILVFAILAGFSSLGFAQSPAPAAQEPRFEIRRFVVEGATLLTPEEIDRAVLQYSGPNRDFADVQRALEALERTYTEKGYSAVQVVLPEQELERGEVRFRIVEARIGKVVIEGNKFFDEANIRNSLPSVVSGQSPNIHQVAENLRVANENPAKQTTVLLRGGTEEGLVDAVVRIADERPTKFSLTFDNTGTQQTGLYRLGVGFQHANLWNRDHVISGQYVTSPNDPDAPNGVILKPSNRVFIIGMSYRIPLYRAGDSLDISAGYSNVNSGVVQNLFNVSGSGSIFGARYNVNLRKWGELEQRLSLGYDWRAYTNRVSAIGGTAQLVPDVNVQPVSVTYLGLYRTAESETSFNVGAYKNLPYRKDAGQDAFTASRLESPAAYFLTRYAINHNRAFQNDWQMRASINGQMTRHKLIAGEQFGIGGADSVRGFLEREVTNDNGHRGTIEFYTPDYGGKLPWFGGLRARTVLFYDWGQVKRMGPLAGETFQQGLASMGFGFRIARGTNFSLKFDFGHITNAGGSQGRNEGRVHASMAYIF